MVYKIKKMFFGNQGFKLTFVRNKEQN